MLWTTATLAIDTGSTDVTLTGDNWQRGEPFTRLNVLGDGGQDWHTDTDGYFQRAADQVLIEHGHTRTGEWRVGGWNEYAAPITPSEE